MGLPSSVENDAKSGWEIVNRAAGDVENASEMAWNDAVAAAKEAGRQFSDPNSLTSQLGHTALDAIGMVPVAGSVAEAANAGWYAAQGDYADAAFSGASAIPVVGDTADAARLTKDGVGIAQDADNIAQDVHGAETPRMRARVKQRDRTRPPQNRRILSVPAAAEGAKEGGPPRHRIAPTVSIRPGSPIATTSHSISLDRTGSGPTAN